MANLCANSCGFFGNPTTNNLCSKCYKEHLMKQSKELSESTISVNNNNKSDDQKMVEVIENDDELGDEGLKESVEGGGSGTTSDENRPANRCSLCKKKVGLTGFICRCGETYCSLHRYSDKHNCVFDYKGAAQDAIARANPVVKADKVDKI